jgi:hypothetical protein
MLVLCVLLLLLLQAGQQGAHAALPAGTAACGEG